MTCHLCETAAATATKAEVERSWSDDNGGREIQTKVLLPICLTCADTYYDGTEEYPGVLPLAA